MLQSENIYVTAGLASEPGGWQRVANRVGFFLRLWRWVPVLWLFACELSPAPTIFFAAPYAAIALAAHLGVHYGRPALAAVAVGVVPQVLAFTPTRACFVGGHLDVAILALVACVLAIHRAAWRERLAAFALTPARFLLLALLPLVVSGPSWGRIGLPVDVSLVLYFLLFAAGLARTPPRPLFVFLLAMTALGLVFTAWGRHGYVFAWPPVTRSGEPAGLVASFPWLTIRYDLNAPAALFTAILYYIVGRIYRRMLDEKPLAMPRWRSAVLPTLGLTLFAIAWGVSYATLNRFFGATAAERWQFLGDYHALPLAAALAGLLLKRPGVAAVAALTILFWFLNPAFSHPWDSSGEWLEQLGAMRGRINPGDVCVVVAFGAVGLHLRRGIIGEESAVRVSRWLVLTGATVALVQKWTVPEEMERPSQLLPLLYWSVAALVVMALFSWWWRRRFGHGGRWHAGWIALLALAGLLQVLWENVGTVGTKLHEMAKVGVVSWLLHNEPGVVPLIVVVVALYLWGVLTAARTFFKDVREWWRDVLQGARVLTTLARRRAWTARLATITPAPLREGELAPPHTWQARAIVVLDGTRYAMLTIGITSALVSLTLLLREQFD